MSTETLTSRQSSKGQDDRDSGKPMVRVTLHVHGRQPVTELAAALSELEHVDTVLASDANVIDE